MKYTNSRANGKLYILTTTEVNQKSMNANEHTIKMARHGKFSIFTLTEVFVNQKRVNAREHTMHSRISD